MVNLRRKVSISAKNPVFFKVYLPNLSSQQMRIPPAFIKKFSGTIPKKAVLRDLYGGLWHVELEKVGKGLFFQNGWQEFVRDTSLELGDFIVFTYTRNSIFDIRLFSRDGCEKEYDFINVKNEVDPEAEKEVEPEAEQTYSRPTRACKRKFSETRPKRTENFGGPPEVRQYKARRTAATNVEKRKVFEAAEFVTPKNPHFVTHLSRYNRYNVNIPKSLLMINNIVVKSELKLRSHSGKLWPVTVCFRGDGRIALTSGWRDFWKGNKLEMQDNCVFEFVLRGRICREMRVQIIRATKSTRKYSRRGTRRQRP